MAEAEKIAAMEKSSGVAEDAAEGPAGEPDMATAEEANKGPAGETGEATAEEEVVDDQPSSCDASGSGNYLRVGGNLFVHLPENCLESPLSPPNALPLLCLDLSHTVDVCLSPFVPDAELRLLPACRHAFHAACVDAWLRNTSSCPLCSAAISLPHPPLPTAYTAAAQQEPLDARSSSNASRSFRVEIGSVSNRRSSAAGDDRRTYSLGSFDYRVDEEVEAMVARITGPAAAAKSAVAGQRAAPQGPGEVLAEAAGSRGWLREYVDRLASSASSLSGRWSARWSQSHHSHRQEDSWRWDPEAAAMAAPRAADEDEAGLMGLYRWIVGV
ncbi:E3 ubiquitin-protein ligase ATL4-like [Triticum aestivum]|uniref:E3 ubiquitin-protein ligase ATL4-like n=1 Tax=Triticum aestivum TaxID=4565 RepID=UPI001D009C5F|nr:E3 ubiquitin-protein ligase ATL4-like [Triticum aestivum]